MFTLNVNGFLGPYDLELPADPREADYADVEEAFLRGHCHSLALAAHELTGWPIIGAGWYDIRAELEDENPDDLPDNALRFLEESPEDEAPDHVGLLMPDGRVWDVGGPNSGLASLHWDTDRALDADDLRDGYWGAYRAPELEAGRVYARHLLNEHGLL